MDDDGRVCLGCWAERRHPSCPTCGQRRPPWRRPPGTPCGLCRTRAAAAVSMAAYRDVIVAAVLGVDPGLAAVDVAGVVDAVTPGREQRRLLEASVSSDPMWSAGSVVAPVAVERLVTGLRQLGSARFEAPRCGTCGRAARCVGRAADGTRLCKACDHRRRSAECAECGRRQTVAGHRADGRALCNYCYRRRADRLADCIDCGERRIVHRRHPDGGALCPRCYMRRARGLQDVPGATGVCVDCGRAGFCIGVSVDAPRCARCYPRRTAECCRCGRTKRVAAMWASGPYCARCRDQVLDTIDTCEACGQARRIDPRNRDGRPVCSTCAGLEPFSTCGTCGLEARLWERGRCRGCTLRRRLDELFADAPSALAEQLGPLRTSLLVDSDRPALEWLCRPGSGRLLARLVDGSVEASHEGLDTVGTRAADHLRHLLVAVGVLPERDDALAGLERWLDVQLAGIEHRDDRHLIETYATWHVLRRRRQRAARSGFTGSTTAARRSIRAAIDLVDWLRRHHRTLAELSQADIDLFVAAGPPGRRRVRPFLSWAAARKLAPRTTIAARPHRLPTSTITAEQVQGFVHRLAVDTTIPTVERAGGLLVALYGQPATRVARLRVDDVGIDGDQITLRLGRHHVELPPVLAELVVDLAANRHGGPWLGTRQANPWLFVGGRPGQPLNASWLAARIAAHGLAVDELRGAALLGLAAELPAAFLADLLGISPGTAVRWSQAAGGEWAGYAAARTTRR